MELLYVLSHVNYEYKITQNHFKATVSSVNYKPYNRSMLCVTNVWWHSTQLAKSLGKCGWQLRGTSITAPPWHIHCKYHYLIISLLSSRTGCPLKILHRAAFQRAIINCLQALSTTAVTAESLQPNSLESWK